MDDGNPLGNPPGISPRRMNMILQRDEFPFGFNKIAFIRLQIEGVETIQIIQILRDSSDSFGSIWLDDKEGWIGYIWNDREFDWMEFLHDESSDGDIMDELLRVYGI